MNDLDPFLARFAHELRNRIAPLRYGLHVLRLAGADGEAAEQARRLMETQLTEMARLVDDLLDLSRIRRGKLELRLGPFDLAETVRGAAESRRERIEQAGRTLDLALPADPVQVEADSGRVGRALSHVLDAAAGLAARGGRVELALRLEGDDAVLCVRAASEGAADPSALFDEPRAGGPTGAGLGVEPWLARRLFEAQGGRVSARRSDDGVEVLMRLPVRVGATPQPS